MTTTVLIICAIVVGFVCALIGALIVLILVLVDMYERRLSPASAPPAATRLPPARGGGAPADDKYSFSYVECDIPPAVTLADWRHGRHRGDAA